MERFLLLVIGAVLLHLPNLVQAQADGKCKLRIDATLMVDWSQNALDARDLKRFLFRFIDHLELGEEFVHLSVIFYNEVAKVLFDLDDCNNSPQCMRDRILTPVIGDPGGRADLARAFRALMDEVLNEPGENGERENATNVLLIISDGVPSNRPTTDEEVYRLSRRAEMEYQVRVAALGVGEIIDHAFFLNTISDPWNYNYFIAVNANALNLTINDMFKLYCNQQEVTPLPTIGPENCKLDITLLIDRSGSIIEDNFQNPVLHINWFLLVQFLKRFVKEVAGTYDNVRIAIVSFANEAVVNMRLDDCLFDNKTDVVMCMRNRIDEELQNKVPFGITEMNKGFLETERGIYMSAANRADVEDLVIFMTDGFPNPFRPTLFPVTENMKDKDIKIIGIGITDRVNATIMNQVVTHPSSKNNIPAKNYNDLLDLTNSIINTSCTIGPGQCRRKIDIAFMVDTSEEMRRASNNFLELRAFLRDIRSQLKLGDDRVRAAMVYFNDNPSLVYGLNDCGESTSCMEKKLNADIQTGRGRNMYKALLFTRDRVFGGTPGDRKDAFDIYFFLTLSSVTMTTAEQASLIVEAEGIKNQAVIITLAIGEIRGINLMFELVSPPFQRNYFAAKQFAILKNTSISVDIRKEICVVEPLKLVAPQLIPPRCPYDVTLMVDASGSIVTQPDYELNWIHIVGFLRKFLNETKTRYRETLRIALAKFNHETEIGFYLSDCKNNSDISCMIEKITSMSKPGDRDYVDIPRAFGRVSDLVYVERRGDRENPNVIIFLTDGFSEGSPDYLIRVTRKIRESGTRIVGVGITPETDENTMQQIVSSPVQKNYVMVQRFKDLVDHVFTVIQQTCISRNTTSCKAAGDIVFIFDSSGSIGPDGFNREKKFVSDLIRLLPIEEKGIRIGLLQFSDKYELVFHLKDYGSASHMWAAVSEMKHMNGRTNTPAALEYARTTMFTPYNGDRPNRPNIAVVLTDGGSNSEFRKNTIEQAGRLKEKAHVIVVQVGDWVNINELHAIASFPFEENRLYVRNIHRLPNITAQLVDMLCNNNDMCDGVECENGGLAIQVNGTCMCDCPSGYVNMTCNTVCARPADIAIALDKSGSIESKDFRKEIDFVKSFVAGLNFRMHRVAVTSFSDEAQVHLDFNDKQTKRRVVESLDIWHSGGGTNTADALEKIKNVFRNTRVRRTRSGKDIARIAVVITDGESNDKKKTWDMSRELRESGVMVLAVAVGSGPEMDELMGMVSAPTDRNVIKVPDFTALGSVISDLTSSICLNDSECSKCPEGSECKVELNKVTCDCPPGKTGAFCEHDCYDKIDLGLLLDVSGSIRRYRFHKVLSFLTNLLGNLTVGRDHTKVGVVTWSSQGLVQFDLDKYQTTQDVIYAVKRLAYVGRRTNTREALERMRLDVFRQPGDRWNAPNFVLMVTDGNSNIDPQMTIPAARRLKVASDATVLVVAVGESVNSHELQGLVSAPVGRNLFYALTQNKIERLVLPTFGAICNVTDDCRTNPCQNGATCVDHLQRYECVCNYNYVGFNCDIACPGSYDIVFLLDTSGSVHVVYDIIMAFARRVVQALPIREHLVAVGLVSFATEAKLEFKLDECTTQQKVLDSMTVAQAIGRTNIQAALRYAYQNVFNSKGDRHWAKNVAVLVSDGKPTVYPERTSREAKEAKERGIRIITVAVGASANMGMMDSIASDPVENNVIKVPDEDAIDAGVIELLHAICTDRT